MFNIKQWCQEVAVGRCGDKTSRSSSSLSFVLIRSPLTVFTFLARNDRSFVIVLVKTDERGTQEAI